MMAEEFAEFDEWLRQVDAGMRESVESAVDVEGDLVAFKQKAFAQIVAVAHAEGNDAPDKAVRSVLADAKIADRCSHGKVAEEARRTWETTPSFFKGVTVLVVDHSVSSTELDGKRPADPAPRQKDAEGRQGVRAGSPPPLGRGRRTRVLVTCGALAGLGVLVGVTWVQAQTITAAVLSLGLMTVIGLATSSTVTRAATLALTTFTERRAHRASTGWKDLIEATRPERKVQKIVMVGDCAQLPAFAGPHQFHGSVEVETEGDEPQCDASAVEEENAVLCTLGHDRGVHAELAGRGVVRVNSSSRHRRARPVPRRVGNRPPRTTR